MGTKKESPSDRHSDDLRGVHSIQVALHLER